MNPIEKFANSYPSYRTQQSYKSNLNTYFKMINADPNTYFKGKRDYSKDILKFWEKQKNIAPLTKATRLSCVRIFLEDNDIIIPRKIWKQIKRKDKSPHPVTIDNIPTNVELKQILSHGELKVKALFLLLSSSGMRITEALKLTLEDIDFNKDPPKIYIRAETTKTKQPRICFMSKEAKEYMLEWLKIRDDYLKSAVEKTKGLKKRNQAFSKSLDDPTIFCFHYSTAILFWSRVLEKSGYGQRDRSTNYHRMHVHVLRKFFKTRMLNAGVEEPIINQLVGHTGYLDNSYYRFTEQELANGYKKGVKSLLIYETTPDLTEVNKALEEKDKQIKEMQDMMQEMKAQILELRLEKLEKANGIKK